MVGDDDDDDDGGDDDDDDDDDDDGDDDDGDDDEGGGGRGFTRSTWCLAIRSVNTLLIAFTALEHKMNT